MSIVMYVLFDLLVQDGATVQWTMDYRGESPVLVVTSHRIVSTFARVRPGGSRSSSEVQFLTLPVLFSDELYTVSILKSLLILFLRVCFPLSSVQFHFRVTEKYQLKKNVQYI